MNKKINYRKIIIIATIAIFLYILGFAYINSHEFIHKQIYTRYNITSYTHLEYKYLSGVTYPSSLDNCNDYCKLSNSLNDIAGYYLVIFIFNTWLLLLAWRMFRR
jgi:hypothetical protein